MDCKHSTCKTNAHKTAEQLCKEKRIRFTPQRQQVFDIIWQSHKALTAQDIMEKLGNNQPPITYRALDFLKENGLIHYIASLNAYVGCMHAQDENHVGQMLICTSCKDVEELVPESEIEGLYANANMKHFAPQQTHIEMLGTCHKCQ